MTAHRPVPYRLRAGPYDLDAAGEKVDRVRASQLAALGFVGARIVWSREVEAAPAEATAVVPAAGPLRALRPLQLLAKEDAIVELLTLDRQIIAGLNSFTPSVDHRAGSARPAQRSATGSLGSART